MSRNKGRPYEVKDCGFLTECWVWCRPNSGTSGLYGRTSRSCNGIRVQKAAHRAYFEDKYGSIKDGFVLDHLCNNPSCVNPDHLEVVTPLENTRRGKSTKLTEEKVAEIKRKLFDLKNNGKKRRSKGSIQNLAKEYNISERNIKRIDHGDIWQNVAI